MADPPLVCRNGYLTDVQKFADAVDAASAELMNFAANFSKAL